MRIFFVMQFVDSYAPMGIMNLSAVAKELGHETYLGVISRENVMLRIKQVKPHLVCYSGSTGEHKYYVDFNRRLQKEYPCCTVVGGPHASFFPEYKDQGGFHILVRGEGERAFEQILSRSWSPGVIEGEMVEDLDSLPFPDRSLFYDNPSSIETGESQTKHFLATRGCPYNCAYCCNHIYHKMYRGKKAFRRKSVEYFLDEIRLVQLNYPMSTAKFYDDNFLLKDDEWLDQFCERYPYRVGVPFFTIASLNLVNDSILRKLSNAGCRALHMSIETPDKQYRDTLLHRWKISNEEIVEKIELCRKYNITYITNLMIGLPFTDLQHDLDCVEFACKHRLGYVDFPIYQPYPKTELGDKCIEARIFDGDYDKINLSFSKGSVLKFPAKRKRQLRNLAILGTVASIWPWTKWLVTRVLIHLPLYRLYFPWFYWLKLRYHAKNVYNYRHGWREILHIVRKYFTLEDLKRR